MQMRFLLFRYFKKNRENYYLGVAKLEIYAIFITNEALGLVYIQNQQSGSLTPWGPIVGPLKGLQHDRQKLVQMI